MSEEEAQYALECVLSRMQEDELRRVLESLPSRALEHIRLTAADFPGPEKPPEVTDDP
jgi:hypothetical protein